MREKITSICFFVFLYCCFSAFSKNTDHQVTPAQIDSLNKKAFHEGYNHTLTALDQLIRVERFATQIKYQLGLTENHLYQGEIYNRRGYLKRALICFNEVMLLSKQNKDFYNYARAEEFTSSLEAKNGNYDNAEKLLKNSLVVFKQLKRTEEIIGAQLSLAEIQIDKGKYQAALTNLQNSFTLSKSTGYLDGEQRYYYQRAELFAVKGKTDSAAIYYHRSLKVNTATQNLYAKTLSYLGLSKIYLQANQLQKSELYVNTAQLAADTLSIQPMIEQALEVQLNIATKQNDLAAIARLQQRLLQTIRESNKIDRLDAAQFFSVLKQQQERELAIQKQYSGIKKISETKSIILVCVLVLMIIIILSISSISYNYKRAKEYAAELSNKNRLIEEHAHSMGVLNHQITAQNNTLEEDNHLKSKLLSVISHDLRHPLTNTKSILDLIHLKLVSHQEAEGLFSQLESQYSRAITLLDNLLYWIKSQVHGGTIVKSNNNLHNIVNNLIEEQKLTLQQKNITAINCLDEGLEWYAERELLRIIFRNLLTNAIKFTHQEGLIQFISEVKDGEIRISVKDDGIGMTEETIKKLRHESQHFTMRGTANEQGSGLGLMLIKDLIKKVGGNLYIQSEDGAGSTFTVCLITIDQETYLQN